MRELERRRSPGSCPWAETWWSTPCLSSFAPCRLRALRARFLASARWWLARARQWLQPWTSRHSAARSCQRFFNRGTSGPVPARSAQIVTEVAMCGHGFGRLEVQSSWQFAVPASSGLLDAFAGEQEVQVRQAYLDVCSHLDKFCFFLSALRPYQRLAAAGGDAALCWLRRSLGHLLQELDKSLLQLRQASLALMQAAKKQLQDLAKRLPSATDVEVQWMKQLRFVDEPRLSELHRACAEQAAQVSSLTSAAREVELKLAAKEGLQQIASAFLSADFQARCSLALPDRLALDMRELAGRTPAAISN
ncbi:unnamed protein product [Effrenium voratum]|uniref:Uncharacterized protein n=1 Tax=Effrenium voratum TaxID=2562239 RepID=A0AA36ITC9_9DINO|nr:unnamed protein product [Effrenium voratum]